MEGDRSATDRGGGSLAISAGLAVLVPVAVYYDFWGGRIPELPSTPVLFAAVAVGAVLGIAFEYGDARGDFEFGMWTFLGFVLLAVVLALFVFPRGLPVSAEVGLVALVWAGFATRLALAYGPFGPASAGAE